MKIACTALLIGAALSFATAAAATGTATTATGAMGAAVPADFEPGSVSFVTPSHGFVLGTSPCTSQLCTALVTTANGSKKWAATTAPPAPFASASLPSSASISKVLFANATDGWVYGPTLWSTQDGAVSWAKVKLGGPVYLLATSAKEVYAVVGSCSPGAHDCAAPTLKLERAAVGSGAWQAVPGVSGYGTTAVLTANGPDAWVSFPPKNAGAAVMIWRSSNSGGTWQQLPNPCYNPAEATDLVGMASPGGDRVFELCAGNPGAGQEGKALWASTNGGKSGHLISQLPLGGLASGMSAPSRSDILVTAVSGATFVYRSTNGGSSWATRTFYDGGAGLSDLSFITPSFGSAVEGGPPDGPNDDRLLQTSDGGSTWSPVHI